MEVITHQHKIQVSGMMSDLLPYGKKIDIQDPEAVSTMPIVFFTLGAAEPPIHDNSSITTNQSVNNTLMISSNHLDVSS
jgi:hypothetical protein